MYNCCQTVQLLSNCTTDVKVYNWCQSVQLMSNCTTDVKLYNCCQTVQLLSNCTTDVKLQTVQLKPNCTTDVKLYNWCQSVQLLTNCTTDVKLYNWCQSVQLLSKRERNYGVAWFCHYTDLRYGLWWRGLFDQIFFTILFIFTRVNLLSYCGLVCDTGIRCNSMKIHIVLVSWEALPPSGLECVWLRTFGKKAT